MCITDRISRYANTSFAVAGFCAVSKDRPLPKENPTKMDVIGDASNGLNAEFGETLHCVAAEPHATFLRVGAFDFDDGKEVAYEIAVLGRLRRGFRVLQMRSQLGTRIELCYLFIHCSFGSDANAHASQRQVCV